MHSKLSNGDGKEKTAMQEPEGSGALSFMQKSRHEMLIFQESLGASVPVSASKVLEMTIQPSKDIIAALHTHEPSMVAQGAVCSSCLAHTIARFELEALLVLAE
jgi:hypothetical protein